MIIEIRVLGIPAPKGSGRAMMRGGKARHVPSGSDANREALADWGSALRGAARAAMVAAGFSNRLAFSGTPIRMDVVWRMRRPQKHFHKAGPHSGQVRADAPFLVMDKPDSSKLLRSTEDILTGIVWDDDCRIAEHHTRKVYADPGLEGATIRVQAIPDESRSGIPAKRDRREGRTSR